MPKRRTRKKLIRQNRRMFRRMFGNKGMLTRIPSVYRYKQAVTGTSIVSLGADFLQQSIAGVLIQSLYFTLNDLPQVNTFTALYDQYRIDKIKIDFIPTAEIVMQPSSYIISAGSSLSVDNSIAPANGQCGLYGSVIDYDDASNLANIAAYLEYTNWRQGQVASLRKHTRTFTPHVASALYQSAFTGYGNDKKKWIDCNSPTVQHYGVKFYADKAMVANSIAGGTQTNVAQTWRIQCTYWVSFKNVR